MNDYRKTPIRWTFWVIAALALVWNILGAMNFIVQMDTAVVAAMPETHRAIIEGRPLWATAGFAVAMFAGVLGCVLLLLRKSNAIYLFILSLLGVLVQLMHTLKVAFTKIELSSYEGAMMIASPVLVALLLIWFTKRATSRGWLN